MPVSLLNADTSFPSFTEGTSTSEKVDIMMNYLYMLLEELRYTFGNLGTENFNDKSLDELAVTINKPVLVEIEDSTKGLLNKLQITAEGLEALTQSVTEDSEALTQFKTFVSNTYATIKSITNLKTEITEEVNGSVNKTVIDALTAFEQTVSETYAKISSLAEFKQEVKEEVNGSVNTTISNAIAEFKQTADATYAKISSLAEFKQEVKEEVIGSVTQTVSDALAAFEQTADATYAKATMFAEYKQEVNGTIDSFKDSVNGSITSITETVANFTANADSKYASATMFASYKTEVSRTYATKDSLSDSISGLETTVSETLASFTATADDKYAKTEQIASITNSSGKVTAASIVAAVNSSGSSVKISADKVDISGFVTFSDLSRAGYSTINGSNITTGKIQAITISGSNFRSILNGSSVSGEISFWAGSDSYAENKVGYLRFDNQGVDSDTDTKYRIILDAQYYPGGSQYVSLKLKSGYRMSLESSQLLFMNSGTSVVIRANNGRGMINLDGDVYIRGTSLDEILASL